MAVSITRRRPKENESTRRCSIREISQSLESESYDEILVEPRIGARADETPVYHYLDHELQTLPQHETSLRLGNWLVRRRLITSTELFHALHTALACSCRIGDVLVDMGLLSREQVEQEALAHQDFMAFL